jgi:hypothetical protein
MTKAFMLPVPLLERWEACAVYRRSEKAKTVRDRYSSPGRRVVEGKRGWFGESG